ncbi:MAG: hypothetical protein PHW76_01545 [Alphaproteobacteria bacterium]|nr:hypothetical protein [Alphaproteobacteria bacterium]
MKKFFFLIAPILLLQACANGLSTLSQEEKTRTLHDIRLGNIELNCRLTCTGTWELGGHDEAKKLYAARDWEHLGLHIAKMGYQSDLTYFYLGRSAEEMGAHPAALKYYQIAGALSTGSKATLKCETYSDCDGFAFPQDIDARAEALSIKSTKKQQAAPMEKPESRPASAKQLPAPKEPVSPAPPSSKPSAPAKAPWIIPPPVKGD